jgi:hypothetical protein
LGRIWNREMKRKRRGGRREEEKIRTEEYSI